MRSQCANGEKEMEMEKRKRVENGEVEERIKKVKEGEGEEVAVTPPPAEDEVEEFFAILRRMHDAVKYFEKGNGEGGRKLTGRWRTVLETEVVEGVDGGGKEGTTKRGERVEESGVLDLNAAPEGENNSP